MHFKVVRKPSNHQLIAPVKIGIMDTEFTLSDAISRLFETKCPAVSNLSIQNIASVKCKNVNLLDLIDYEFEAVNDRNTPIFEMPITITMKEFSVQDSPRQVINASALMMRNANQKEYLEFIPVALPFIRNSVLNTITIENEEEALSTIRLASANNIQKQIKELINVALYQLGMGYSDDDSKRSLVIFTNSLSNVLCFIHKHWKALMREDFPTLPTQYCNKSMFLSLLKLGVRRSVPSSATCDEFHLIAIWIVILISFLFYFIQRY